MNLDKATEPTPKSTVEAEPKRAKGTVYAVIESYIVHSYGYLSMELKDPRVAWSVRIEIEGRNSFRCENNYYGVKSVVSGYRSEKAARKGASRLIKAFVKAKAKAEALQAKLDAEKGKRIEVTE